MFNIIYKMPRVISGSFISQRYTVTKKNASDGYRRPVLTSETTKRKKLSYKLLYNKLIEGEGSMDDGQTGYM